MTRLRPLLLACLLAPALPALAADGARTLAYPPGDAEAPVIRLHDDGMPVSLYFPDHTLDPRAAVHHLSDPHRFGIRIAERTAWLFTVPGGGGDPGAPIATLTLAGGRPLAFRLEVVPAAAPRDLTVRVQLPPADGELPARCRAAVQQVDDELAECREGERERRVDQSARLLSQVAGAQEVVAVRHLRRRGKQNRMWVEALELVRVFDHLYLRLRVDNRDDILRPWRAGEASVVLQQGEASRRLPVTVVSDRPVIGPGEGAVLVVAVEAPADDRARLDLILPEADGDRHLLLRALPASAHGR